MDEDMPLNALPYSHQILWNINMNNSDTWSVTCGRTWTRFYGFILCREPIRIYRQRVLSLKSHRSPWLLVSVAAVARLFSLVTCEWWTNGFCGFSL